MFFVQRILAKMDITQAWGSFNIRKTNTVLNLYSWWFVFFEYASHSNILPNHRIWIFCVILILFLSIWLIFCACAKKSGINAEKRVLLDKIMGFAKKGAILKSQKHYCLENCECKHISRGNHKSNRVKSGSSYKAPVYWCSTIKNHFNVIFLATIAYNFVRFVWNSPKQVLILFSLCPLRLLLGIHFMLRVSEYLHLKHIGPYLYEFAFWNNIKNKAF